MLRQAVFRYTPLATKPFRSPVVFNFSTKITASMVKELRESTGAPMMECKKALTSAAAELTEGGNLMEASIDLIRKSGSKAAAKKAGRNTAEGLVGVMVSGNKGIVLEVNSETDFVARNQVFQKFLEDGVRVAASLEKVSVEELLAASNLDGTRTMAQYLTDTISSIRENIQVSRVDALEAKSGGTVQSYMHQPVEGYKADSDVMLGRIACVVALDQDSGEAKSFGDDLAMHVAAGSPRFLDPEAVPQEVLDKEKAFLEDQARESGKPAKMIEKIVAGRLNKFYEENCLINQRFLVSDGEGKAPLVGEMATGKGVKITGFLRMQCGRH